MKKTTIQINKMRDAVITPTNLFRRHLFCFYQTVLTFCDEIESAVDVNADGYVKQDVEHIRECAANIRAAIFGRSLTLKNCADVNRIMCALQCLRERFEESDEKNLAFLANVWGECADKLRFEIPKAFEEQYDLIPA